MGGSDSKEAKAKKEADEKLLQEAIEIAKNQTALKERREADARL